MTLETQTQPNSPDPQADNNPSPATPDPSVASPSPQNNGGDKPAKPDWLDDAFFDAEKGVKLDDLGAKFKELSEFKSEQERITAERKAGMPEKAEDYGTALPENYKLPEGYEVDPDKPQWKLLQEVALARGLTKAEFSEVASKFVDAMAAEQSQAVEAFRAGQAELFKQLGSNGDARVEAVKSWMKTAFGEKVAPQLHNTLFTPDIVKAWETVQRTLTDQGVMSFNGSGREGEEDRYGEDFSKKPFREQWASKR